VYYGSAIPDALDAARRIDCPTIMHWGDADPFIPRERVDAVAAMAADHPTIECHVHEGSTTTARRCSTIPARAPPPGR
ncbi:MAG: dienelactone hydrolase family protein, partial [Solirubrobacteraceae bacterium]